VRVSPRGAESAGREGWVMLMLSSDEVLVELAAVWCVVHSGSPGMASRSLVDLRLFNSLVGLYEIFLFMNTLVNTTHMADSLYSPSYFFREGFAVLERKGGAEWDRAALVDCSYDLRLCATATGTLHRGK